MVKNYKSFIFSQMYSICRVIQFTYAADKAQLRYLQLLSTTAYQNITYNCLNSVAYYDAEASKSYDLAAKFMTSDDKELKALNKKLSYSVSLDECQVTL